MIIENLVAVRMAGLMSLTTFEVFYNRTRRHSHLVSVPRPLKAPRYEAGNAYWAGGSPIRLGADASAAPHLPE